MSVNFIHKTIGNVFVQRWTGQATLSDVEPMIAAMRGASDALAPTRMIGVCIVPSSVALPTPAAARAMDAHYREMFQLAAELYVIVEPGSFRSARLIAWTVTKILTAQGRDMRVAHSVAEALRDAETPRTLPDVEIVRRARAAGLIFATDRDSSNT